MEVLDKEFELRRSIRLTQGYRTYVLSNDHVEVAVVPELGARILSLVDRSTGRDWMWFPNEHLKLFRNEHGADFSLGPMAGADECLPTIAPCPWEGRQLPDHGEVWGHEWTLNHAHWEECLLTTSIPLSVSPFKFTRSIELRGSELHLRYQLTNLSHLEERFIWAMHPLLRLRPGDRLRLPASTRSLIKDRAWLQALDEAVPEGGAAKLFLGPLSEGCAGILNPKTGEQIDFEWNPSENPMLGLWLTRGGWKGYHHFALEPTNCCHDALSESARRGRCGTLPGSATVSWNIKIRLGHQVPPILL